VSPANFHPTAALELAVDRDGRFACIARLDRGRHKVRRRAFIIVVIIVLYNVHVALLLPSVRQCGDHTD